MKKTILTLALLAGLGSAAQAQYRGRGGNVSLGLKAGASLTDFVGPNSGSYNGRFGFHAGIFANIGLTRLVAFQPELLYSQKGAQGNSDAKYRFHYVDVPLVFHINTDGFFFEGGPQIGFLAAAQYQVGDRSVAVTDGYKMVDVGYVAGLGYQLKHGLGAGLRYNGEFTNFPNPELIGNVKVQAQERNSAFQLYATYSFN